MGKTKLQECKMKLQTHGKKSLEVAKWTSTCKKQKLQREMKLQQKQQSSLRNTNMSTLNFEVVAKRAKFSKKNKYLDLELKVIDKATQKVVKKLANKTILKELKGNQESSEK